MSSGTPKVSPVLQVLLDKGLFDRLPVTFSTFFFDQIKDWDLLFPAERSYYERLFTLLDRSNPEDVNRLFAPMIAAEQRMGVNEKVWPRRTFTLEQVDLLNRNPHYPEWRKAVAGVFSQLDPVLDAEVARRGHARLVVVLSPGDLPVGPDRMWSRVAKFGTRVPLDVPQHAEEYIPLLLTGSARPGDGASLLDLCAKARNQERYSAWSIEAGDRLSELSRDPGVVRFSYKKLEAYRTRLMNEVQKAVNQEQIRGPRQLGARLKQMQIRAGEGEVGADAVLAEFARAVLLAGNGTLLLNNTFVEWATMQAVRRARPTMSVIGFGIRNKVKPFSSLLIYADQESASPVPTQADVLGSWVDLEIFYQYVWQEFGKYPEYRGNTAFLFVGDGLDEMLVIGPKDFPLLQVKQPIPPKRAYDSLKEWMGL